MKWFKKKQWVYDLDDFRRCDGVFQYTIMDTIVGDSIWSCLIEKQYYINLAYSIKARKIDAKKLIVLKKEQDEEYKAALKYLREERK